MSEINNVLDHQEIDEHTETIAFLCAEISLWKGGDCVTYLCFGVPCNRSQVTTAAGQCMQISASSVVWRHAAV